ncbi:formylglycine-generating enzyme family protein [Candidatus Poribacteria bacterium]|nr:formylglycine-generating enzyme family protein [Candidatus Poribacteria bacterium]
MVLIPAGEFEMGVAISQIPQLLQWAKQSGIKYSSDTEALFRSWHEKKLPRHTVYLDAFYIDVYEVTNAQYKKFINATGHPAPPRLDEKSLYFPNQPVASVSWYDAMAYAKWAGKRLPTEAEWEKAARGGLVGKYFPWGDEELDGTQCNLADKNAPEDYPYANRNVDDGYFGIAPVGSYPPNGYGLYDMAGNVSEWCLDEYQEDFYGKSPQRNPMAGGKIADVINNFTTVKSVRVIRGGSWMDSNMLVTSRRYNDSNWPDFGFRCAVSIPP